ncbi:hypothetical protein ACQ4M4_27395 [Leptolyngbya sp. AN02str]|uniref:hypothetical protein n=1 Tax=Leptolyngbya sp. AN02str TaxID=3423363 RepID=UPI003D3227A2
MNENTDLFSNLKTQLAEARKLAENILKDLGLEYASAYVALDKICIHCRNEDEAFEMNKNRRAIANRIYELGLSIKHLDITDLERETLAQTMDGDFVVTDVGPRSVYRGKLSRIRFPFQKGRYLRDEYFED